MLAHLTAFNSHAEIKPNALISDGMVLQQKSLVKIWGEAAPQEKVTLTFRDETVSTVADAQGNWLLQLPSKSAGGPFPMTIAGSNTIDLPNVYVGEVWLLSGQSNMEYALWHCVGGDEAIANSTNPQLRLITIPHSLLFVFQIGPNARFPYALTYLPGGFKAMINDSATEGRIYLHYGSVLVAVTSSQCFTWNPAGGIRAPAAKLREGDSEFRVPGPACALAIETAPPADFPGASPADQLATFRERVRSKSALKLKGESPASARYQNRLGDTLECTFNGPDLINGETVDYQAWPTSESPWTAQKRPDDPLILTDGKIRRSYDFKNWKIDEQPK